MQPKTLAATQFAPQSTVSLSSLAVKIPMFLIAAFVTALLVAKVEAVSYPAGAVPPDADLVYETLMVSP